MRKIGDSLLNRLTRGDLVPLVECIKKDKTLRLEVRKDKDAFIYYKKGKALELKRLYVDPEYGNVPDTKLAISNPCEYFSLMKDCIDSWLVNNNRNEFDTQQKIAQWNQDIDDRYIILDMEYSFKQGEILPENREKQVAFDLIGIERETNKIIIFELKNGMGAANGKSGIKAHIDDFEAYFNGKNSKLFKSNLLIDIKNIVNDKNELGLLDKFKLQDNLEDMDIEFVFILHPDNPTEIDIFKEKLDGKYELLLVNDEDYKLN